MHFTKPVRLRRTFQSFLTLVPWEWCAAFRRKVIISKKKLRKLQFSLKSDKETDTVREDLCIFMGISLSVLLRLTNVSDKSRGENQNTHFVFNNPFFSENRAFFWGYVGKILKSRTDHRWWYGACVFAWWITKATDTYSQYVIHIDFPCQQWATLTPLSFTCAVLACLVVE